MDNKFESIITESRKRQLELFGKKKKNKDTKSSNSNEKLDIGSIKQIVSSVISSDLEVFDDGNNKIMVAVDKYSTEPIDDVYNNFKAISNKLQKSGFSNIVNSNTSSTDFSNAFASITLENKSGQQVQILQGHNDDVGDTTAIIVQLSN